MTTQEQAYINGFVKRASEYGLSYNEAAELLKTSGALTTINNMRSAGAHPAVLERLLSSRKALADDIRQARNTAGSWAKDKALRENLKRPSTWLEKNPHPLQSVVNVEEAVQDAAAHGHEIGPKDHWGHPKGTGNAFDVRELSRRLRPAPDLSSRVFDNVEGMLGRRGE